MFDLLLNLLKNLLVAYSLENKHSNKQREKETPMAKHESIKKTYGHASMGKVVNCGRLQYVNLSDTAAFTVETERA